jgi:hypothetical protein
VATATGYIGAGETLISESASSVCEVDVALKLGPLRPSFE